MISGDLGAPAFAWVTALGAFSGVASYWLFRRTTNAERLRQTANRIVAHLLEIRLFAEEPILVLRAQRDLLVENVRILRQVARPVLVLFLPLAIMMPVLECFFGHAPLRVGESTLVTVQCKGGQTSARLEAPDGVAIEEPPVYVPDERALTWQIHADRYVDGYLWVSMGGARTGKRITVSDGFAFLPPYRTGWPFSSDVIKSIRIEYRPATVLHVHWLWWFGLSSFLGAGLFAWVPARFLHVFAALIIGVLCMTESCSRKPVAASLPKVIVLGVDGMDPAFVERHWDALPNLRGLRDRGYFGRLRTTNPPQSPVAWSTFITGLDPDQHGIYDFVHRNPATLGLFSSMSKTDDPKFVLPLGPYLLPLSSSRVSPLRRGTAFWRTLTQQGIPAIVQRMPVNYPPEVAGKALSGMGTPDLLGTLGTFTFFTDDPVETARSVSGGRIVKAQLSNGRAELGIEGPPNPLRKDHAVTVAVMTVDVDPVNDVARIKLGDQAVLIRQGKWSGWLTADFPLIPHISSVRGTVRVFAKQLHPGLEIYVSPINLDPTAPALPISSPANWSAEIESELGPYSTLGIPEDTSALRQEVLTLPEFREQAELVFADEAKLLDYSLRQFMGGFLFFYFSSVDQNSHILWGKHEDELLKVYREVDDSVGLVRSKQPDATLMIISDHGFTTFDRAVHLNAWLKQHGFLNGDSGLESVNWQSTEAYAVGLNGLYLNLKGREKSGIVSEGQQSRALLARLRDQLLQWQDNGKSVIDTVTATAPAAANKNVAPDLLVGYAAGYRASWQTALGEIPGDLIEDNNDAWIADHCVNPDVVPGVLFSSEKIHPQAPRLQDVTAAILKRFGIAPPEGYHGQAF